MELYIKKAFVVSCVFLLNAEFHVTADTLQGGPDHLLYATIQVIVQYFWVVGGMLYLFGQCVTICLSPDTFALVCGVRKQHTNALDIYPCSVMVSSQQYAAVFGPQYIASLFNH